MSPKVVILGAGYAGISAAKRLARGRHGADVTLVNPRDEFVERVRLHQFVAGNHPAVVPLADLLPASTNFVLNAAERIDADNRRLELADGGAVDYDYLIYAVGSRSRLEVIPGAAEHAVTLGTLEDAVQARERVERLPDRATITVVGGGLTGIETAAELAELGRYTIRLVTDQRLGASVSDRGRAHLHTHFAGAGVDVVENTAVTEVQEQKLLLADGRALGSDLTIVVAAFGVPGLASASGLTVGSTGALRVSETLTSVDTPTIVGAGDGAISSGEPLRMSCQVAEPTGVHAAETVLDQISGRQPKPLRPKFVGQNISLGRRAALVQFSDTADRPRPRAMLTGRIGALVKEQVCVAALRFGHLGPFSVSWSS